MDSQELKATLSTTAQSLSEVRERMKIGKWERRTKSVQTFFIEPERSIRKVKQPAVVLFTCR